MQNELLLRLAVALSVGLVIGIERGWRQREVREGGRTAGVRTFALIGLLGGLSGLLSLAAGGPLPWLVAFALLTAVFTLFAYREGVEEDNVSVTSVVAAMAAFLLGVLAASGDMRIAAAGGVATAGVLASRAALHRTVERLTWPELRSALLLLAMTVIVLPVLPDRPVDPLRSLNPRELWLLMSLVAAVSYAGYVALKIAGPDKGPLIAGMAGGLTSSTAATIAMARLSRETAEPQALASGAALASMVSLIRASFLAAVAQPTLLPLIAPPAAAAAAAYAVAGLAPLVRRRKPAARQSSEIGIPFELTTVLGFGVLLAVITFGGAWITGQLGSAGAYVFSAVSGLVDVDAVTLAQARSVGRGVGGEIAAAAILIAFASNAAARAAYAFAFGSRGFALRFAIMTAAAAAVGGVAWLATELVA
jgi:uncharacterized membrane protein (DUF4010 family)